MVPPDEAARILPEVMAELAAIKAENAWLKRQLFGPGRSEKLDRLQTSLALGEPAPAEAPVKRETITYERAAAPKEKPWRLSDGAGLYLLIRPSGEKWWRFDYRYTGKDRTLSMGIYPATSLKAARERVAEARDLVAQGIDPSAARKDAKASAPLKVAV